MMAKARGTCLRHPSRQTKACRLNSWTNGSLMTLKVPLTYQYSTLARSFSWSGVARMRSVPSEVSATRRSSGTWSLLSSKSRLSGCWGCVACVAWSVRCWRRDGLCMIVEESSALRSQMADFTIFSEEVKQFSGRAAFSFSWKETKTELKWGIVMTCLELSSTVVDWCGHYAFLGLYSLSGWVSYPKILWSLGSREIWVQTFSIELKFDRHISNTAVEIPVRFQSEKVIIISNLAASGLHKMSYRLLNRGPRSYNRTDCVKLSVMQCVTKCIASAIASGIEDGLGLIREGSSLKHRIGDSCLRVATI